MKKMKEENKKEDSWWGLKLAMSLIIIFIIFALISTQVVFPERESGTLIVDGAVIEIERDIIFGGTFTDWRNELHFEEGTKLWMDRDCDLSGVKIGIPGRYTFEKNYFMYDGAWYHFHELKGVQYFD